MICDRRTQFVREAIRIVRKEQPDAIHCSDRHLRRLYAKHAKDCEQRYLAERDALAQGLTFDLDTEVALEMREGLIGNIARFAVEHRFVGLLVDQPVPLERWTAQEMVRFLVEDLGVSADDLELPFEGLMTQIGE